MFFDRMKSWSKLSACLLFLFLAMWVSAAAAQIEDASSRGQAWLEAKVQADGSLEPGASTVATDFQARSEVARTLLMLESPVANQLLNGLAPLPDDIVEYRSRLVWLNALGQRPMGASLDGLLSLQNADGGFPPRQGSQSEGIDTALALLAIHSAGSSGNGPAILRTTQWLLGMQRADGGFDSPGEDSHVYATASAMMALQGNSSTVATVTALSRASNFLIRQQNPDGGWGSMELTAWTHLALLGAVSDSNLQSRVSSYLLSGQGMDGSWSGDAYVTALALRALLSKPTPPVTTGGVVLRVQDGASLVSLQGVTINLRSSITGGADLSQVSNEQGQVRFVDVPVGSYSLIASMPAYESQTFNVEVSPGVSTDLGYIGLRPAASTAILFGVVSDGSSGQPLAGAAVSLAGSSNSSVITTADGRYRFTGLTPGRVTVSVVKQGYDAVTGTADLVGGGALNFSPTLLSSVPGSTLGRLSGLATHSETGAPLSDVTISLTGAATAEAQTGSDGRFALSSLNPGVVTVSATKTGFDPISGSGSLTAGGVLSFNPVLRPSGSVTPIVGTVSGLIVDDRGQSIEGVMVSLAGSGLAPVLTAASGEYALNNVPVGPIEVTAAKAGYTSVSGVGSMLAGQTVLFSPVMKAANGSVSGLVLSALDGTPLSGAAILLQGSQRAVTDQQGRFAVQGLEPGQVLVRATLAGYSAAEASALVGPGVTVDLGSIRLARSEVIVNLTGSVSRATDGTPIPQASVTVQELARTTTTGEDGAYRLDGLPGGLATIRCAAPGFASQLVIRNLDQTGEYTVDCALADTTSSGTGIDRISVVPSELDAYSDGVIQVSVNNADAQARSGTLGLVILDAQGNFVDGVQASWQDGSGVEQQVFRFEPGVTPVNVTWNAANRKPGQYTVVAKLMEAQAMAAGNGVVLSSRQQSFTVRESRRLLSAKVTPVPAFSNVGSEETLAFSIEVVNRSNVAVSTELVIEMSTPGQAVVYSGVAAVTLMPHEASKVVTLTGASYRYAVSGFYPVTLRVTGGSPPDSLQSGAVSIAPGIRIEPTHRVSPLVVTPDGDKTIQLNIELRGVEQQ